MAAMETHRVLFTPSIVQTPGKRSVYGVASQRSGRELSHRGFLTYEIITSRVKGARTHAGQLRERLPVPARSVSWTSDRCNAQPRQPSAVARGTNNTAGCSWRPVTRRCSSCGSVKGIF